MSPEAWSHTGLSSNTLVPRCSLLRPICVLPDDHRAIHRPRVRQDPRDVRPDVVEVREEDSVASVAVYRVRTLFQQAIATLWERERDLHPPADVNEGVWQPELLDELADRKFL